MYLLIIWYGLKSKLTYRLSSVFELAGKFLEISAQVFIWITLLGGGVRFDTTLPQMITYLIIMRVATMLVESTVGGEMQRRIREGSIATDFSRPINLKGFMFCNDLGNNIFKVMVVMLPISIVFGFAYNFLLPETGLQLVAFLISLIIGTFAMFHYNFLLGLISFWLLQNPFIRWHFRNVEQVFSGLFFPIWFYPVWLANITLILPFRYFTFEAVSIYLGMTPVDRIGQVLSIQLAWAMGLYLLSRIVWIRASKRVIVQGG